MRSSTIGVRRIPAGAEVQDRPSTVLPIRPIAKVLPHLTRARCRGPGAQPTIGASRPRPCPLPSPRALCSGCPGPAQWNDNHRGPFQIGPHVRHLPDEFDTRNGGQSAHLRNRPSTDQEQGAGSRTDKSQAKRSGRTSTLHRHSAGSRAPDEHARATVVNGLLVWAKVLQIHSVGYRVNIGGVAGEAEQVVSASLTRSAARTRVVASRSNRWRRCPSVR